MPAAIESHCRIASGSVLTTGQVLNAGDHRAQVGPVKVRGATPGGATVIGIIGAGITLSERAAWRTTDRASPGTRHIVVGCGDHTVGIVRIHGDRGLVLRGARKILVDGHGRSSPCRTPTCAREHKPGPT